MAWWEVWCLPGFCSSHILQHSSWLFLAEQNTGYNFHADAIHIISSTDQSSTSTFHEFLSSAPTGLNWNHLVNRSHFSSACRTFLNLLIQTYESVRYLDTIFDSNISFSKHIDSMFCSVHYQIHRIEHHISSTALIPLRNALTHSYLDSCNSPCTGMYE